VWMRALAAVAIAAGVAGASSATAQPRYEVEAYQRGMGAEIVAPGVHSPSELACIGTSDCPVFRVPAWAHHVRLQPHDAADRRVRWRVGNRTFCGDAGFGVRPGAVITVVMSQIDTTTTCGVATDGVIQAWFTP
jgi:hypothetical protein